MRTRIDKWLALIIIAFVVSFLLLGLALGAGAGAGAGGEDGTMLTPLQRALAMGFGLLFIAVVNLICAIVACDPERRGPDVEIPIEYNRTHRVIKMRAPTPRHFVWFSFWFNLGMMLILGPAWVTKPLVEDFLAGGTTMNIICLGPFAPIILALPIGYVYARLRPYQWR